MSNDTEPGGELNVLTVDERRQREVLRELKLELLGALAAGQERSSGSNPYDSKLGRPAQDVWNQRRRA
jgi:hypothetical protein